MKKLILKTTIFLIGMIFISELLCRFVFPTSEMPYLYYNEKYQIRHFDTTLDREGVFTFGKLANRGGLWKVNNYGWNSDFDYTPKAERTGPMIAVMGASDIEGFYINHSENLWGRLRDLTGGRYEVANISLSGAPFSEIIQITRYAQDVFAPEIIVIKLSDVSIEISITERYPDRYRHQITFEGGKFAERPMVHYKPSSAKRMLRHSALASYLFFNRSIQMFLSPNNQPQKKRAATANNVMLPNDIDQMAAEFMVALLVKENPESEIVLIGDADRNAIYANPHSEIEPFEACRLLGAECGRYKNCHYLDLTETFQNEFLQKNEKFNTEFNLHWNVYGHDVVARALYKFMVTSRLIEASQ